jgi:membrane-bound serine protease (ClpP class)
MAMKHSQLRIKSPGWHWFPVLALAVVWCAAVEARPAEVMLIKIDGAIVPVTADYIQRAAGLAAQQRAACLIVQLDTPGGLLPSTEKIVQEFYASPVPVVVYVAPSGAFADSAGCFITLAADVAAMAPNTTIGAAHPIQVGAGGVEPLDDVMKQKLENAYSTYIKSIAQKRGRNADWAITSVRNSESLTAEEALASNVVDVVAADVPDLLRQLDGREAKGSALKTAGAAVVEVRMLARERLFQLLWHPEVLLLLMLAAIYGIIGEVSHPGAILPGVVGAIALILALYMAAILPVNLAGVALMLLAVVLFVIDAFAPTHGVLTFGGIVAFFLGALLLFNGAGPAFRLSLVYVVPATLGTAAFFIFIVGAGLRAQSLPVRAGAETMLGKTAPALAAIDQKTGKIFVEGEYWNAVSDAPIEPGRLVEIVSRSGLTLKVRPKPPEPKP